MENEMMAGVMSWAPILFMLVIFYFLLYKPQKKARQERDEMLAGLKVGAEIITVGGIYGEITRLEDEFIMLKIADDVEIKISRNAVGSLAGKVDG